MEKGFREVRCAECKAKLKIPITEKDYGQKLRRRCPKCKTVFIVFIPVPAVVSQEASASNNPFSDFSEVSFGSFFEGIFKNPKK